VETKKNTFGIVEFTPQSFLGPDLDLFFGNFSPNLVGVRPKSVLIDGAVVQTTNQSFDFNGESDLDLEYGMGLTNPQPIILLQTGDLVEGAGFDNWLDAVDASFCTFEGGDDPTQDGIYPDPLPGGFLKDLNLVVSSNPPTLCPSLMDKMSRPSPQRLLIGNAASMPNSALWEHQYFTVVGTMVSQEMEEFVLMRTITLLTMERFSIQTSRLHAPL